MATPREFESRILRIASSAPATRHSAVARFPGTNWRHGRHMRISHDGRQVCNSCLVGGVKRLDARSWLSAARHPERRDGVITVAWLVAPWVLWWALAPRHHFDATATGILVAVSIGLATLWLTWAALRNAGKNSPADSGAGSTIITAESVGQVVYQPHRGVTGKPVRLAAPPPLLAGRADLLDELHRRLTSGAGSGPQTVVLSGLGGSGKTSVALAYAHRHLAEVRVAWQFASQDPTVLQAGFAELAAQLGARDRADDRDPVASVHGTLAAFSEQWLLIFDNAPDQAAVLRFLPPAGRGRVLVTSRNPNWPAGQVLDVPVLDTEAAAGFLMERTGDHDKKAAAELAAELGGLPLALEQAGAYIQVPGGALTSYLYSFRQRRPDMLARGKGTGNDSTVATTWELAFRQLEQSATQATGLLRLLAFCAPEAFPLGLLLQRKRGRINRTAKVLKQLRDPVAVTDAVAELRRYSLVAPAGDGAVSVHRLVQAVTADQMPPRLREAWRVAAADLIEAAIPADPSLPESWPVCAALLPHAQAALDDDSVGMQRLGLYLGYRGNYAAALELGKRVLDGRERSRGPMHPETLAARNNLALWIGKAGDPAGARDQFAALVPIVKRVWGAKHRDTLAARANLALWIGEAGDPAGARDQYIALLPVLERVLGPEHPTTFYARNNLAAAIVETGDAAGGRDQFAALLPVLERALGPDHPDTLDARRRLAYWTQDGVADPGADPGEYQL